MTTTSRPSMPPGFHLHAPSWRARHAADLAREVAIIHLPIDPARWPAGAQQKAPAEAGAQFRAVRDALRPIGPLRPAAQRLADGSGRWWRQPCDQ
jgi:hypothetical protein